MCQTATACLLHPPVSEASSLKNLKCRQYGIDSAERMAYISDTSPRIHEPRPCAAASAGMPFWPFHSPYTAPGDAMFRYVHTNIIAKNAARLIAFYKQALHCKSIGQTRDLRGPWLDRLTGLPKAHITGEHLLLPGYDDSHPTLEFFLTTACATLCRRRSTAPALRTLLLKWMTWKQPWQRSLPLAAGRLARLSQQLTPTTWKRFLCTRATQRATSLSCKAGARCRQIHNQLFLLAQTDNSPCCPVISGSRGCCKNTIVGANWSARPL